MCNHCSNFHIPCSRCNRCYTKNWCSVECLTQDWEERHHKFCHKDADMRKVKKDAKSRDTGGVEMAMKGLHKAMARLNAADGPAADKSLNLSADDIKDIKEDVEAMKEMCQKKKAKKSTQKKRAKKSTRS